jgi:hypothetical protein
MDVSESPARKANLENLPGNPGSTREDPDAASRFSSVVVLFYSNAVRAVLASRPPRLQSLRRRGVPRDRSVGFGARPCSRQSGCRVGLSPMRRLRRLGCVPHFAASLRCIHLQAVVTISSKERFAFQPRSCSASAGSATSAGGSPGRRGAMRVGTLRPVTCSILVSTCFTEEPWPVPRFSAREFPPPDKCSSADTCASARSFTWM